MDLRDRIISESLKLFSLKGFLSTSLQDILDAANTSKGGFYNHFKTKEILLTAVLSEARKVWRERVLFGIDKTVNPVAKVEKLLLNYRDRYIKDSETFPGGCIFVALSVELDDQIPHLARELNEGFVRLKAMIHRLLDQGKESGEIRKNVDTDSVTEMIFAGLIGAAVVFGMGKSTKMLDNCLNSLIEYLESLK
jgi:AcrR family transcriptional regulator